MENFLKDIYKYANLIFNIKEIILKSHCGYDSNIHEHWSQITPTIIEFCQLIANYNPELCNHIYSEIENATKSTSMFPSSYSQFADSLEELLPSLYTAISYLGQIDVSDDDYHIKSSKSGFLSLIDARNNYRYTSTIDPMSEAFEHAHKIYDPFLIEFHFLGVELGYLPYQVYMLSNQSIDIHIYHTSHKAINFALQFGILSWIPEGKLHIHINADEYELLSDFTSSSSDEQQTGNYIYPDMVHHSSSEYKSIISGAYISNMNYSTLLDMKNSNSYRNMHNQTNWLSNFVPSKETNNWSVIAGGPSLDEQIDYLRKHQNNMNIICATTVLKKMLSNGIKPDCVVSNDPKNRTFGHFDGLTDFTTPLLMAINSNWQFGECYPGPVYLVLTHTNPHIEAVTKSNNQTLFNPGRNITTFAVKLALFFGAKSINLFGVDFSYPNGLSHASGTMDCKTVSTKGMLEIPGVNGQVVYTTQQFMLYISELTEVITQNPQTIFTNYSSSGAFIEGTKWFHH